MIFEIGIAGLKCGETCATAKTSQIATALNVPQAGQQTSLDFGRVYPYKNTIKIIVKNLPPQLRKQSFRD